MTFAAAAAGVEGGGSRAPGVIRASKSLLSRANKIRAALNRRRQAVAGGAAPNKMEKDLGEFFSLVSGRSGQGLATESGVGFMRLQWKSDGSRSAPVTQNPWLVGEKIRSTFRTARDFVPRGRNRLLFTVNQDELDRIIETEKAKDGGAVSGEWKLKIELSFNRTSGGKVIAEIEIDTFDRVRKGSVNFSSFADMSEEKILEKLKDQNVIGVKRFKNNQDKYVLTFKGETTPQFIKADYQKIRVWEFAPSPFQCRKCLEYGHVAKKCEEKKPRCKNCSAQMSDEDLEKHRVDGKCKSHCFLCAKDGEKHDHAPTRMACFHFEFESLVALLRAERGLSPRAAEDEAMKLIENRQKQLITDEKKEAEKKAKEAEDQLQADQLEREKELDRIRRETENVKKHTELMQKEIDRLEKAKKKNEQTLAKLKRQQEEIQSQQEEIENAKEEIKVARATNKKKNDGDKVEEVPLPLTTDSEKEETPADESKMDTAEPPKEERQKRSHPESDNGENDLATKTKKSKAPKFYSLNNIHKRKDTATDAKEVCKWVNLNRLFLEAQGSSPIADFNSIVKTKSGVFCNCEDDSPYSIVVRSKGNDGSPVQRFTALTGGPDGIFEWRRDEDPKNGSSTE